MFQSASSLVGEQINRRTAGLRSGPSSPACPRCGAASSLAWVAQKTGADSWTL